jgi:hypothetical protein
MPASLIKDENGMGILCDITGYLGQVQRHRIGIAPRHDKSGPFALLWTDRSKDIG